MRRCGTGAGRSAAYCTQRCRFLQTLATRLLLKLPVRPTDLLLSAGPHQILRVPLVHRRSAQVLVQSLIFAVPFYTRADVSTLTGDPK